MFVIDACPFVMADLAGSVDMDYADARDRSLWHWRRFIRC
jgi:hypothetical protein